MSLQYVELDARCDPRLCGDVYLCLQSFWTGRTQTGVSLVQAKVLNVLGKIYVANVCNPTPVPCADPCADPCNNKCRYSLSIDDSQFLINPATNLPYVVSAGDVLEVSQLVCTIETLLSQGGGGGGGPLPARMPACSLGYFTGV